MSLVKALATVAARGLEGAAKAAEKQDAREDEWTKVGVTTSIKKIEEIKKQALADSKAEREKNAEINSLHGTVYGTDKATGDKRMLSRAEIGQLIGSIGKEKLIEFAMEDSRLEILGGKATAIRTDVATGAKDLLSATTEAIPTGESGIAKGQAGRVSKKVESRLAQLGYDMSTLPTKTGTTTYAGGQFAITPDKKDDEFKVNASFVVSGKLPDGSLATDISAVQGSDGLLYINDPRIIGESDKPIRMTTEYTGMVKRTTPTEDKINAKTSFVANKVIDGKEVDDVSLFMSSEGELFVNDPRIIGDTGEPVRIDDTYTDIRSRVSKTQQVTYGGPPRAIGDEVRKSYTDTTNFKNMQKKVIDTHEGQLALKDSYDAMWEEASNPAVYSTSVTLTGGLFKKVKVELEGIKVVLDPSATNQVNQDRVRQIQNAEEYITRFSAATDASTQARVLDSKIFVAAVRQAQADGEDRPTDRDIAQRMDMFRAKDPKEFFMKAQDNVTRALNDFNRAYGTFTGQMNPLFNEIRNLEKSENEDERKAAAYLRSIYEPVKLGAEQYTPSFLVTANVQELEEIPAVTQEVKAVNKQKQELTFIYDPERRMYYRSEEPNRMYTIQTLVEQGITLKD